MKQELEALEKIYTSNKIDKNTGLEFAYIFKDEIEIIKQSLTPPTSDEVCEELHNWIEENSIGSSSEVYYDKKKKRFEVGEYEPSICYLDNELIFLNWFKLPPHLIIKIGQFYQALEENNE